MADAATALPALAADSIPFDPQLEEELNNLLSTTDSHETHQPDVVGVLGSLHKLWSHQQELINTGLFGAPSQGLSLLSSAQDVPSLSLLPSAALLPSLSEPSMSLLRVPSTQSIGDGALSSSSSLVSPNLLDTFSFDFTATTLPGINVADTLFVDTSSESDLASSAGSPGSSAWQGADHDVDRAGRPGDIVSSLTAREREILAAKGFDVSGNTQLTPAQEKVLRQERRKIRNKDSAKESRRKKAEYMAGVERRAEERDQYKQRCETLEKENAGLTQALQQLQSYLVSLARALPTTSGLPLMMLLCTFCFAFTPSLLVGPEAGPHSILNKMDHSAAVKSRVLLSIPAAAFDTCPDTKHALRRDYAWAPVADELHLESLPIMPSEAAAAANKDKERVVDPSNETALCATLRVESVADIAATSDVARLLEAMAERPLSR